jgi:hypothetical protein
MRVPTRIHKIAIPAIAVIAAIAVPLGVATSAAAADELVASGSLSVERSVDHSAAFFALTARATSERAAGKVDTSSLDRQVAMLDDSEGLPAATVDALTVLVRTNTARISQELDDIQAREEAAAQAAAQAAAAAAALAQANTPDGARAVARSLAASRYGWGDGQFSCLQSLWQKESGWNYKAYNKGGGATGIPQALPGSKMAAAGADWQTNAATQISWGLSYIQRSYGSPCAAWAHSQAVNWY